MNQKALWREIKSLTAEAQQEVLDFIAFLRSRQVSAGSTIASKKGKKVDLAKEPFVHMWSDREDMADSGKWVRETREREWKRP